MARKPRRLGRLCALLACAAWAAWTGSRAQAGEYAPEIILDYHEDVRLKRSLPAFNGVLLGFDGGDWNGALVYVDPAGRATRLYTGNILGIARSGQRIVVFSSLAHLPGKRGELLEVTRRGKGLPTVRKLADLDGRPLTVYPADVDGDAIAFRLFRGEYHNEKGAEVPVYHCMTFAGGTILERTPCPSRRR